MLLVVGPAGPTTSNDTAITTFQRKPEAATAVYKLLMMGKRMPETCWAVFKRRAINLRDWYIWLVDLFEFIDGIHMSCDSGFVDTCIQLQMTYLYFI